MKRFLRSISLLLVIVFAFLLYSCNNKVEPEEEFDNLENKYIGFVAPQVVNEGISWPNGQVLPRFSTPSSSLYQIFVKDLSPDERITFSAFQGLINKDKTQIYLAKEDHDKWAETYGLDLVDYTDNEYELLKLFQNKIKGVVLYNEEINANYRNAAATIAALNDYLPVNGEVFEEMQNTGMIFSYDNVIDLTLWTETTNVEIFTKIYDEYWSRCTKRLLLLANPKVNTDHCRDLAAATGAATIFLDTDRVDDRSESDLFEKFVKDMADSGETTMILGWGKSERSPIVLSSKYGIGIVPADHFISSTLHASMNPVIEIPKVPNRDTLKNKVYVACFLSDGDNIQYTQGAMRLYWDREEELRGNTPVTWTIAPSLADIAPGIMNYYYSQASDMECFATGPSGISYLMAINTGNDAYNGVYLTDAEYANAYAKQTAAYLLKTGLRVITIWDDATPILRQALANNCRNLYGATVQQFQSSPIVNSSVENNSVLFDKLRLCYGSDLDYYERAAALQITLWNNKNTPLFMSYQIDRWNAGTEFVIELEKRLKARFGDNVEFVRADHYYSLYNEYNGMPFNLCNLSDTVVTTSDGTNADAVLDGTPRTMWTSSSKTPTINFDFQKEYDISRYIIEHAGLNNQNASNNKKWRIEYSVDGEEWLILDRHKDNTAAATDIELTEPVTARYVRITFFNPDDYAKVAGIEFYGSRT